MIRLIVFSLLLALGSTGAQGQQVPLLGSDLIHPSLETTIEQIGTLENRRDPKCYATASRLEDFMYGTPLTEEARFRKIEVQKNLILSIWNAADAAARVAGATTITSPLLRSVLETVVPYRQKENGDWTLATSGAGEVTIHVRDKRQYSTIAYALRAILAVQQDALLQRGESLAPLDDGATETFKDFLDLYTLACLFLADRESRQKSLQQVPVEELERAWYLIGRPVESSGVPVQPGSSSGTVVKSQTYALTRRIVEQKVSAYDAYNNINAALFLRNVQVYFARHRWPSEPAASDAMKAVFTEIMVGYAFDLLVGSDQAAVRRGESAIRIDDVNVWSKHFIPHRLNEYEDAIFFPHLPGDQRVTIEAYDMDAFRDGGLHWKYLEAAIGEPDFAGKLEPDPFALELLVENIAQFGVLVLRTAGSIADEQGGETLTVDHLKQGFRRIQERVKTHPTAPAEGAAPSTLPSASSHITYSTATRFFTDVSETSRVDFEHRTSDWLSRFIRRYSVRDQSVALLAIPPAFGGSGAAAEDINGDGFPDLLLLGGLGNRLYLNTGEGTFSDITSSAGIAWARPDGTPGETRQPIIADFDNDGLPDIFISYVNDKHRLYRNLGDGRFQDVTDNSGLGGEGLIGGPVTAIDYDRDGKLDLYVTYFGQYIEGVLPTLARKNENGLPNKLFRNVGGFRFEDVTEGSGVSGSGWTQAASHTDFDLDGWQDLIEGNDFGVNAYYRNRGDGTFEDISAQMGTDKPSYTMSIGITDLNKDSYPDIYISNIVTMDKDQKYVNPDNTMPMKFDATTMANMRVIEANDLFVSSKQLGPFPVYSQSTAIGRGRSATGWSWGADFLDFDKDGDDDLYVGNGMNEFAVYSSENPYYRDPQGNVRDVQFPQSSRERNVFFVNEGGILNHSGDQSGADLLGNTRAVVYLDLEGDGDLDMALNNYQGKAVIYRNNSEQFRNNWLKVRLIGDPAQTTTRDAIGARLIVTAGGNPPVWREIHSSIGYLTMHPKVQQFGLGTASLADLEINWPNGEIRTYSGLEANKVYSVNQQDGSIHSQP